MIDCGTPYAKPLSTQCFACTSSCWDVPFTCAYTGFRWTSKIELRLRWLEVFGLEVIFRFRCLTDMQLDFCVATSTSGSEFWLLVRCNITATGSEDRSTIFRSEWMQKCGIILLWLRVTAANPCHRFEAFPQDFVWVRMFSVQRKHYKRLILKFWYFQFNFEKLYLIILVSRIHIHQLTNCTVFCCELDDFEVGGFHNLFKVISKYI